MSPRGDIRKKKRGQNKLWLLHWELWEGAERMTVLQIDAVLPISLPKVFLKIASWKGFVVFSASIWDPTKGTEIPIWSWYHSSVRQNMEMCWALLCLGSCVWVLKWGEGQIGKWVCLPLGEEFRNLQFPSAWSSKAVLISLTCEHQILFCEKWIKSLNLSSLLSKVQVLILSFFLIILYVLLFVLFRKRWFPFRNTNGESLCCVYS